MINNSELVSEIEDSDLDEKLFEELLEEHDGIRKAYNRKDYEKTLNKTGKFVETTFQLLQEIKEDLHSPQPNFNDVADELENLTKSDYPEGIRILIPRVAKSMYDFRSKRGGVHKVEIDPQYIDAHLTVQGSRWIIAEFLRIYGDGELEIEKLESQVQQLATAGIPWIEEFEGGDIKILKDPGSANKEVLLVLYHFYPKRMTNSELQSQLDHRTQANIGMAVNRMSEKNYLHKNENGSKLTIRGRNHVQKNYGMEIDEEELE